MKKQMDDPLADARFSDVVRALRALPPAKVPDGFAARVVAAATDADPLAAGGPFEDVVRTLRSAPPPPAPAPAWTNRTVAMAVSAGRSDAAMRRYRLVHALEAAAAIALLVSALYLYFAPGAARPSAGNFAAPPPALRAARSPAMPQTPLQVLLAAQRPDGAFSSERDSTGVTALAVLALLYNGLDDDASMSAAVAGLDHLVAAQRPDGSFGGEGPLAAYNGYLATKALQAAARLPGANPGWATAAARAMPHFPEPSQVAALNRHLAHPELSVPTWQADALPAALALLRR